MILFYLSQDSLLPPHEYDRNHVSWCQPTHQKPGMIPLCLLVSGYCHVNHTGLSREWETSVDCGISEAQTEGSQGDLEHFDQKMARVSEWGNMWEYLMDNSCVCYFYLIFTMSIWSKGCLFFTDTDTEAKSLKKYLWWLHCYAWRQLWVAYFQSLPWCFSNRHLTGFYFWPQIYIKRERQRRENNSILTSISWTDKKSFLNSVCKTRTLWIWCMARCSHS